MPTLTMGSESRMAKYAGAAFCIAELKGILSKEKSRRAPIPGDQNT
jgi:hypothetical protein